MGLPSILVAILFFIISRAFQGLGIAFVLPNVLGIIGNIYVGGTFRKNIVISFVGAMAPIGATLGCLFCRTDRYRGPKTMAMGILRV